MDTSTEYKSLIKKQIQEEFKDLSFNEEEHRYFVGEEEFIPVSYKLKKFYKPFDKNIANYVAKRDNTTAKEVLKKWDEIGATAAKEGTEVHEFAENYALRKIKNIDLDDKLAGKKIAAICYLEKMFTVDVKLLPELRMYHKLYKFAGTADLVWITDKGLVIDDYKTNTDLFKAYGYLLKPFANLENNSFNKYQLQLSHYKMMIEQITGIEVYKTRIIHLKPYSYKIYETEDFSEKLKEYYENRRTYTKGPISLF